MNHEFQYKLFGAIAGVVGWIWIVASVAALYFLATAVCSDAPWSNFFWAVGTSIVAKWLTRGFADNQKRVAFETNLIAAGKTPEEAEREWRERYARGAL